MARAFLEVGPIAWHVMGTGGERGEIGIAFFQSDDQGVIIQSGDSQIGFFTLAGCKGAGILDGKQILCQSAAICA